MTQKAQALALAEPDTDLCTATEAACQSAGYELTVEPSAEVATSKLGAKRFDALVLDMMTPGAALVCLRARGKLVRTRIPVIALVEEEDEVAFARAYRAGADEVLLSGRLEALTARLRSLPKSGIPQPGASRGDAVVADADRARAEVLERVLRDSGFRVELAVDGFAARLQVGRPALKVAVLDASLDDVPALITQSRTRGARCAWIVRGRPDSIDELRAQLSKMDRVAVVNAYGPPDDVLFEANRLIEPREVDGRADTRLLYGTIVRLKWDGHAEADIAYTYNVSTVGLYVRTLAAPVASMVDLELLPPGMDKRTRLKGEVIWRREFGTTRREPVPAGFGVKITGGDLDVWAKACPRALSMPPRSVIPVREEPASAASPSAPSTVRADSPPALPTVRPDSPVLPSLPAEGPRRASFTEKLRLPERPRVPVTGAFAAAVKARKSPSPVPPGVSPKDEARSPPPPKAVTGREPQSSVEEMLLSVLGGGARSEDVLGSTPLGIDGGEVVELGKADAERAPSEEPPPPSAEAPRPVVASRPSPPAPKVDEPPTSAPVIELEGDKPSIPVVEPERDDSERPTIEIHDKPTALPRPDRPSDSPMIEVTNRSSDQPLPRLPPPPRPAPSVPRNAPPEPIAPEAVRAVASVAPPSPSFAPRSLEVESRDLVPEDASALAAALAAVEPSPNPAAAPSKPPDPFAATMRGISPLAARDAIPESARAAERPHADTHRDAAAGGDGQGAVPKGSSSAPYIADEPTVVRRKPAPVQGEHGSIAPDGEIEIPKTKSFGMFWLALVAVVAGAAAFLVVNKARESGSPALVQPGAAPARAAPESMAEPPAPSDSARPGETASGSAPIAPSVVEAASGETPTLPQAATTAPASAAAAQTDTRAGEEPDPAALQTLEKGSGFLFVQSPLQTNVYLYGILAGKTNERLVSKCGPRFIRLGTAPGSWQSAGVVAVVKCGGLTRVQIAP